MRLFEMFAFSLTPIDFLLFIILIGFLLVVKFELCLVGVHMRACVHVRAYFVRYGQLSGMVEPMAGVIGAVAVTV